MRPNCNIVEMFSSDVIGFQDRLMQLLDGDKDNQQRNLLCPLCVAFLLLVWQSRLKAKYTIIYKNQKKSLMIHQYVEPFKFIKATITNMVSPFLLLTILYLKFLSGCFSEYIHILNWLTNFVRGWVFLVDWLLPTLSTWD